MAKRERWQGIPTGLNLERFREFVLPHLSVWQPGGRTLKAFLLHVLFNYILKQLDFGMPVEATAHRKSDANRTPGDPLHLAVWRAFRRWEADGCFNAIFEGNRVDSFTVVDLLDCLW